MVSRYGKKIRQRAAKASKQKHTPTECPKCSAKKVSSSDTGAWKCAKCKAVFAGGSYSLKTG